MSKHLAIFVGDAIDKILRGEKTVEVRLSLDRIPPYEQIKKRDEIYLKESGGKIHGKATVDNVLFYDNLEPEIVGRLRKEYAEDVAMPSEFWELKAHAKFATIIFLKAPQRFLSRIRIKKGDRRPWVILEKDEIEIPKVK